MLNVQIIWITWIGEHNIIKYLSFWITPAYAHKDMRVSTDEGHRGTHASAHIQYIASVQKQLRSVSLCEWKEPPSVISSSTCASPRFLKCFSYPAGCFCPSMQIEADTWEAEGKKKKKLFVFPQKKKRLSTIHPAWHANLDKLLCDRVITQISFWTRI